MKLREYGFILWKLSGIEDIEPEQVGDLAWNMRKLVEDWSADNGVEDNDNADWLTEPYNDWVASKDKKGEVSA